MRVGQRGRDESCAAHRKVLWHDIVPALIFLGLLLWHAAPALASAYTEGAKSVLMMRVDFSDKPGEPVDYYTGQTLTTANSQNLINTLVSGFYAANSDSKTSLSVTTTPVLRMPQTAVWYGTLETDGSSRYYQMLVDARTASKLAGFDSATYNFDILAFSKINGFNWGGLGYVGGKGAWLNGWFEGSVTAHELGHNYGLPHANLWKTTDASVIGAGANEEYGNPFDVMGGGPFAAGHFNNSFKNKLDWMIGSDVLAVSTSGTYSVNAHDISGSAGRRALKIVKDANKDYWVEYRQNQPNNVWLMNGAFINWGYHNLTGSHLLDMTPGSADGANDASLLIGRTFSDTFAGVHITPIRKGVVAPNVLDVVVNLGAFPNNRAPTLTLNASTTSAALNQSVTFTANGTDADGDAVALAWDFGDRTFDHHYFATSTPDYSGASSKAWGRSGSFVVRCTASDLKGGTTSSSVTVTVGAPTTFQISGRVTDNNQQFLADVAVQVSQSNRAFTNSDGYYTLTNLATGSYTVSASKAGYAFSASGFANPVSVGPNRSGVNFIGSSTVTDTQIVTNTADSGAGSLRQALTNATTYPGTKIVFNIPAPVPQGGYFTIQPLTPLPSVTTNGTIIDGATQSTFSGNTNPSGPEIVISGATAGGSGLAIAAANCAIKNLVFNAWADTCIRLEGAGVKNNTVQSCYLGTNATGTAAVANGTGSKGIYIAAGANANIIGGSAAGQGNLVSGNGLYGIYITASGSNGNLVRGNIIGLNAAGTAAVMNGFSGVVLTFGAQNNIIGGGGAGEGNVISSNKNYGIHCDLTGTSNNTIQGNLIGTNAAGNSASGNGFSGIILSGGASGNQIGGSATGQGNVISGHVNYGFYIMGAGTSNTIQGNTIGANAARTAALSNNYGIYLTSSAPGTLIGGTQSGAGNFISGNNYGIYLTTNAGNGHTVQGNTIGANAAGSAALGTSQRGIVLSSSNNVIGGTQSGAANRIAFHTLDGVLISSGTGNAVRGNAIWNNNRLGINLNAGTSDSFGVTANDAGDADSGLNNLQNYPVLQVTQRDGQTTLSGTLDSVASASFAIDFYRNAARDASTYGEGEIWVDSRTVTTDSSGKASFALTLTGTFPGQFFAATATKLQAGSVYGDTSEFSVALAPTAAALSLSVTPTSISEALPGNSSTATVTRNTSTLQALVVNLAVDEDDQITFPATVTIPAGQNSATFTINAIDDNMADGAHNLTLTASAAGHDNATATLNVTDDDTPRLTLTVEPATFGENAGATAATATLRHNIVTDQPLTVELSSSDVSEATVPATVVIPAPPTGQGAPAPSAPASGDKTAGGTVAASHAPGSTTFSIAAIDDTVVDGSQSVTITASATGLTSGTAAVTVTDDDQSTLKLAIAPLALNEGDGANAATGTISRNTATTTALQVTLSSSDGSAATVPSTVEIPIGQTSVTFAVAAIDDAVVDGPQTATVAAAAAGFIGDSVLMTVADNDVPTLSLSLSSATFAENAGANAATATVSRNTSSDEALTVQLSSSDGSAATVPLTVEIPIGQTSVTFAVAAVDDAVVDGTQSTSIAVASNGFAGANVTATVTDNEVATLTLAIEPATIGEGDGANAATGTVSRNTATTAELQVTLSSNRVGEAAVANTVTIPAGATSTSFAIAAVEDDVVDGAQSATIEASATGFVSGTASIMVNDNDSAALALTLSPGTFGEGSSGTTATLHRNTNTDQSLQVALAVDKAGQVTIPATVTIAAGQATANFAVAPIDDAVAEPTQSVTLSANANGYSSGTATVTITDNDTAALSLKVQPPTFNENAGAQAATATVTRNTLTGEALTIALNSSNSAAATVPATVVIASGQTSVTFAVAAVDDNLADGTQSATLHAEANGLTAASAIVQVQDNEAAALSLTIAPTTISEAPSANTATATLSRNTLASGDLTVVLASSATAIVQVPATVTIPSGAAATTFAVTATDDIVAEEAQNAVITASASGLASATAQIAVNDDDEATLSISIAPTSFSEAAGGQAALVTVTRNTTLAKAVVVQVVSSDTSAAAVPSAVTIADGSASTQFWMAAVDDSIADGSQTATITASRAGLRSSNATVTVEDNEIATLSLALSSDAFSESGSTATATVSRNSSSGQPLSVQLESSNSLAAQVPDAVTIPAGAASAQFEVTAVNDSIASGSRSTRLTARAPGFVEATATVSILDDDVPLLALTIAPNSFAENAGANAAVGTLTRNTPLASALTVALSSSDVGAATVPSSITIAAGAASATFAIAATNDALLDGTQTSQIRATAPGFGEGVQSVTVLNDDLPGLTLRISPATFSEKAGPKAATATVSRTGSTASSLTVSLVSSDKTEATVPSSVTLRARSASMTFFVSAVDDRDLDGPQTVTITARGTNRTASSALVTVSDDERAALSVSFTASTLNERGGAVTGIVTRNTSTAQALPVSLASSDVREARVPAAVTIPRGARSAKFRVSGVDDTLADGARRVSISARRTGFASGQADITVSDDETPTLTLVVAPLAISEAAGARAATGVVTRNTLLTAPLTVNLSSSDLSEARVPATVTIPIGRNKAEFSIAAVDDIVRDGTVRVTIAASRSGFTVGRAVLAVSDNEVNNAGRGNAVEDDSDGDAARTPSPLRLSRAFVRGQSDTLVLIFNGALDAESATDIARYVVWVNGEEIPLESVDCSAARGSIALSLPEGILQPGDALVVQWTNLWDASGRQLSGQTELKFTE